MRSASSKARRRPKISRSARRNSATPRSRWAIATDFTVRRASTRPRKAAGIRRIVGAELTLDDDSPPLRPRAGSRALPKSLPHDHRLEAARAQSPRTRTRRPAAHRSIRPRARAASRSTISNASARGLICLAGGVISPLSRKLMRGRGSPRALRSAGRDLRRGQSLHRSAASSRCRRGARSIASSPRWPTRAHIPIVATNDVCHGGAGSGKLLDVLTCIRLKTTLEEAGRALWVNSRAPSEVARRDGRAVPRSAAGASPRRARSPIDARSR